MSDQDGFPVTHFLRRWPSRLAQDEGDVLLLVDPERGKDYRDTVSAWWELNDLSTFTMYWQDAGWPLELVWRPTAAGHI